jgi:hypothetical protein
MIVLGYSLLAVSIITLTGIAVAYGVYHITGYTSTKVAHDAKMHAYAFLMADGTAWYRVEPTHMDQEVASASLRGYLPYMSEVHVYKDGERVQIVQNSNRVRLDYTDASEEDAQKLPRDLDVLITQGRYGGHRGRVVDRMGDREKYLLRVEVDSMRTQVEAIPRTDFITREEEPLLWT